METISEQISQVYRVRREVSQIADLPVLLLAKLQYEIPSRTPAAISQFIERVQGKGAKLDKLAGGRADEFSRWLYQYLLINSTVKGKSFYPIHPALSLSGNGEGVRVDGFIEQLSLAFTNEERETLIGSLWSPKNLPAFERSLYDLIGWQFTGELAPPAKPKRFIEADNTPGSVGWLLHRTKEDFLSLAKVTAGLQDFITHAGRLLAFSLSRYLLAQAGISLSLPIYTAPAADTHEGVKALSHEILELHRTRFADKLRTQFLAAIEAVTPQNPESEDAARQLAKAMFHSGANIVPKGEYANLLQEYGSFAGAAYHYYWTHSGAKNRFLRQLHASYLNNAKKAGFVCSRSDHSKWHFYWMAPPLIQTLLLASRSRLGDRVLVSELLADWRDRYSIALKIELSWEEEYRKNFREHGSPEVLNEANERRFLEILAEQGRLHKNSDDFPWVVLRD